MRVLIVVAALVLLGGCGRDSSATSRSSSSPPPPQAAPAWLVLNCQRVANAYHDSSPQAVSFALTTISKADPLVGAKPTPAEQASHRRVYVVVMQGSFTDTEWRGPAIATPSPHLFTWLVTVTDAKTHVGMAEGETDTPPDTSGLHLATVTL